MIDVVDALRELVKLELPPNTPIDETGAQPFEWNPGLYAWCETQAHRSIGTGEVREDFIVMLVYVVETHEEAMLTRTREATVALDTITERMLTTIRLHANVPPWDSGNIIGSTNPDFLRQLEQRGQSVQVDGYRLKGDPANP
jgi:hypothetical protein